MDFLALVAQTDPGPLFGWIQAIAEQLGIWTWIEQYMLLVVVMAGLSAFLRFMHR